MSDDLVTADNMGGVFHVHTDWSDGGASILDMARGAANAGFGYIGISDHSRAATYANGLDRTRLAEQKAATRSRGAKFRAARSSTASRSTSSPTARSISTTTSSAPLDFVIASVHSRMVMGPDDDDARGSSARSAIRW